MLNLIKNLLPQFIRNFINWRNSQNELDGLDFNQIKTFRKINTLRKISWASKERYTQPLSLLYDECKSDGHLWIIGKLLQDFEYVDSNRYVKELTKVSDQIESIWNLKPANTMIIAISENDRPDGSQAFVHALGPQLNQNWKNKIINNIGFAFSEKFDPEIENIVLADDFIGTGEKMAKKLNRLINHFSNKYESKIAIYVVALAGMSTGISNIKTTKVKIFVPIKMEKAISVNIRNKIDRTNAINSMIELEQNILPITPIRGKFIEYNFGYKLSEALYYQEGANIPNNVFPIFWKDSYENPTKQRYPLFRRSRK